MDWMVSEAFLLVNKRGVARTAMVDERPAQWTSRYGSVSFNQYGRDFPLGGMNETGLVIENLWLDGTRYPDPDARPALNVLSWIQYQLDMSATVDEVIYSHDHLRISSSVPLHFFVADRQGEVATIEFLGGRMVHHTGDSLPVAALTNTTYRESLGAYERNQERSDASSLGRFAIASRRVAEYPATDRDPVEHAFETLRQARQTSTQWSEVYEIDRGRLHYRTRPDSRTRTLDLLDLDFSCSSPVVGIDIHADVTGDVLPHLRRFTARQNLDLIRTAYEKTPFLADRPEFDQRQAARHADDARCVAP
jgi:choloylglycine hydrolase